jgi:DNA topoisomerase-1
MKHILNFKDLSERAAAAPAPEKAAAAEPWWKKYTKYELSVYPVNVPEKDVTVDLTGDIDTHPVLTWNSPTTGKKVYSYTKARVEAQKAEKYERIKQLSQGQVDQLKSYCHDILVSDEASEERKQAAAVAAIIAQTGLRPGSKQGFETTHNRGVMTLAAENFQVDGGTVRLHFTGKSYQENRAEFEDGAVASYLEDRLKGLKPDEFVFDISKSTLDDFVKGLPQMAKFKVKDLRTHIANRVAMEFLEKDPTPPPPVPNDPGAIKKSVKAKLKKAFEAVSQKLNNTPAMAKGSYVDPSVILTWLKSLGIAPSTGAVEEAERPGVREVVGNVPVYDLPDWWDSDDIELQKVG